MIDLWSLDGRTYDNIPVIEFEFFAEILDGSGTGRMQAIGWPMHRQPEGTIFNVSMVVGIPQANTNSNPDFVHLINTLNSFGQDDFKTVSFISPMGIITQEMYSPSYSIKMKRITRDGVTYWGTLPVQFIAKQAYIT